MIKQTWKNKAQKEQPHDWLKILFQPILHRTSVIRPSGADPTQHSMNRSPGTENEYPKKWGKISGIAPELNKLGLELEVGVDGLWDKS